MIAKRMPRKILLYIVYGDDQVYYEGALFSILTFMHWVSTEDNIEVFVLTENPVYFSGQPIKTIKISKNQKNDWSLNGAYHFRIKNRGMAFVIDELMLEAEDKILFFDTDTYFHKSPLPLFNLISSSQALFFLNEGLIYERKRFAVYVNHLQGKKILIDGKIYELSKKSALWGSLMIGIEVGMRPSLEWADKLMLRFLEMVPAHTIEPFALSESLLRDYKLVEGKNFVSLYSTSRKKEHVKYILSNFFKDTSSLSFADKVALSQKIKLKRPLLVVLRQRLEAFFNC